MEENRISLKELASYKDATEAQRRQMGKDPYYDLNEAPAGKLREELAAFIMHRAECVSAVTVYKERQYYKKVCRFLQKRARRMESFCDRDAETWIRQMKGWMLSEGIPLTYEQREVYGTMETGTSRLICYFIWILEFTGPDKIQGDETEKIYGILTGWASLSMQTP